ncbi:hypothetical protein F1539_04190 [Haemophilus influenzae biotype aegyptius]|nr:hypothetical protein F1541_06480 [Haemophilus influenzae biotype aegyptius]QEQ59755.1 hypothetical protein F1540_02445 [Haemophilus influenzae biotype aegyptius]QEQ61639.1 hypothetical protein F1539_04190 [Haemophilus influenzae biotype aegyptius]QEQ62863.1 hypothetical protein F1538_00760 [Haemophilus influenzae biotype aegyptius]QEQ65197.1 hypothetical protein F1537_03570 [Haemophilus influenzae biotype aegyptius]
MWRNTSFKSTKCEYFISNERAVKFTLRNDRTFFETRFIIAGAAYEVEGLIEGYAVVAKLP